MSLVPRRNLGWFTTMGTATMVVYLFHGFVIKTFMALGWPDFTAAYPTLGLVLTVLGAVGLAFFSPARPCGGCSSRSPTRSGWVESRRRPVAGRPPRRSDRGARHDVEGGRLERASARARRGGRGTRERARRAAAGGAGRCWSSSSMHGQPATEPLRPRV